MTNRKESTRCYITYCIVWRHCCNPCILLVVMVMAWRPWRDGAMYAVAGGRGSCASPVTPVGLSLEIWVQSQQQRKYTEGTSWRKRRQYRGLISSGWHHEPEPEPLREQWHGGAGWGRHVRRGRGQAGSQLRHGRQVLLQPGQTWILRMLCSLRCH